MQQKEKIKKGVYFLANDKVLDWALAFLQSFRRFNPTLELYLIPFDAAIEQLLVYQSPYQFKVFEDEGFERLEKIGQDFELGHSPYGPNWFRRYAAFWGPLDHFLYLDTRHVVLHQLDDFLDAPLNYDLDLVHYDCALDQVYEPGKLRTDLLKKNLGRGFLSGIWASKKGIFTLEELEKMGQKAMQIRNQLNPRNTDQAFLNYCCDCKPLQYAHIAELLGQICHHAWAGQRGRVYKENDKYYLWDYGGLDHKKQLILMHWAGIPLHRFMPQSHIFGEFYPNSLPLMKSMKYTLMQKIKRNRLVNSLYHQVYG